MIVFVSFSDLFLSHYDIILITGRHMSISVTFIKVILYIEVAKYGREHEKKKSMYVMSSNARTLVNKLYQLIALLMMVFIMYSLFVADLGGLLGLFLGGSVVSLFELFDFVIFNFVWWTSVKRKKKRTYKIPILVEQQQHSKTEPKNTTNDNNNTLI